MQYPADRDVFEVIWFHKMMTHMPVAKSMHSQRTCEAILDACLHLSHSGLFTSPITNKCPLKWQCPVSNPVIIVSWFLLRLSRSPAFFAEGFFYPAFVHIWIASASHVSCVFSLWSLPWQLSQIYQLQAEVLWLDARSLLWLIDQLFHFHHFPCDLAVISVHPCYVLPVSPGVIDNPRLVYSLSGNY